MTSLASEWPRPGAWVSPSRNEHGGTTRPRGRHADERSRAWWLLALVLVVLAWPDAAAAYRPFDGTDAAVVDKGVLEIELGPVGYLREASAEFVIAPAVVLNWGLSSRWEVVLQGANVLAADDVPGRSSLALEDTGLFLKGVLREGSLQGVGGPSIATEFGVLLPAVVAALSVAHVAITAAALVLGAGILAAGRRR